MFFVICRWCEYIGTEFHGLQRQANHLLTVQACVEEALREIARQVLPLLENLLYYTSMNRACRKSIKSVAVCFLDTDAQRFLCP
jgi:tRNA U38,U39,U40 pseudouridine synthase TruA